MPLFLKFCITILALIMTLGTCREIKDKRKRIIVTMAILLAISTFSNRSIYWFIYWDGPYFGQMVDADSGEPIEGASVAGVWQFEDFILLITSLNHFATAKETVTDAEGKFTIPLTFAFTFWPMASLEEMDLVVFKPGYDSHPPAIQRAMKQPPEGRRISSDGKYYIGAYAHCKAWRKCEVRLNKAINIKEEISAYTECKSRLSAFNVNQRKVSNFIEVLKKPKFKYRGK
jgi:hypothetical protein